MSLDEVCKDSEVNGNDDSVKDRPIQVVITKNHSFELDIKALECLLLNPDIADMPVVVVSVAGAFRKGKSFLLDFFLRYMNSDRSPDWLDDEDAPLDGFPWKGGSERLTSGIQMWSRIFKVKGPKGKEYAVVLLDTQGAFDSLSTVKDCATIFALSTMLSSVQVFNLSQNIQEDDLQHLHLFTDYGRLALSESCCSPFQKLQFLIRDWSYPYEYEYGQRGGSSLLKRFLEVKPEEHSELQQVRENIESCFSNIECFLLPHPGLSVATNPRFIGRICDIDKEFVSQLKVLVPCILAKDRLIAKTIEGREVTCRELNEYFKSYMELFLGDELPEPKTMLQATAEANNLASVATCKEYYAVKMESVCGGDRPFVSAERLDNQHQQFKHEALAKFHSTKKMGGSLFELRYSEKLELELETMFESYTKANTSKNIFQTARTPATLFVVIISCYVSSAIAAMIGIYFLANLANLTMGCCLLMMILWAYCRYSGDYHEVAQMIDEVAEFIWQNAVSKLYYKALKGLEFNDAIRDSRHSALPRSSTLSSRGSAVDHTRFSDIRSAGENASLLQRPSTKTKHSGLMAS